MTEDRGSRLYWSYLALILLTACAESEPSSRLTDSTSAAPQATIDAPARDTSRMVVYDLPVAAYDRAPRFVMSSLPVTEVSGRVVTGDLAKVFRPLLLRDGRIVLFLDGSVVVIGPDGEEVERIGRPGAGPGEFRDGVVLAGLGDTLIVHDRINGRLTFVVPGSGVVRMRPLSPAVLQGFTGVIGQYADDALLVGSQGFGISAEPDRPTVVPWYSARLAPRSEQLEMIDSISGPTIVWHVDGPTVVRYSSNPVVVAWGTEFLISDGEQWSLERVRADGVVQARYQLPMRRRPVTAAQRETDTKARLAEMRARRTGSPSKVDTTKLYQAIRNSPAADSLPAIDKLLIGTDSIAWIKDGGYWYADSEWGWTALHRDGTILGRLVGKGKDPVVAFGANRVLLRSEDGDGFVTFRVHALTVKR